MRWKTGAGGVLWNADMTLSLHELMKSQQSGLPEQVLHNIKPTPILNKWSLWLIAYTKEVLWVDSWWKRRNQFGGWSHLQVSHSPVNIPAPTHSLVTLVVLMPMTTQERRKEVGRGGCWWLWRELKERTGSGYDHISLSTCMKFSRIKRSYKINNFIKQIKE